MGVRRSITDERKSDTAYGGGVARKLRPRHVATVVANELLMKFSPVIIRRLAVADKTFSLWGHT